MTPISRALGHKNKMKQISKLKPQTFCLHCCVGASFAYHVNVHVLSMGRQTPVDGRGCEPCTNSILKNPNKFCTNEKVNSYLNI